jgi:hypothetical protein
MELHQVSEPLADQKVSKDTCWIICRVQICVNPRWQQDVVQSWAEQLLDLTNARIQGNPFRIMMDCFLAADFHNGSVYYPSAAFQHPSST